MLIHISPQPLCGGLRDPVAAVRAGPGRHLHPGGGRGRGWGRGRGRGGGGGPPIGPRQLLHQRLQGLVLQAGMEQVGSTASSRVPVTVSDCVHRCLNELFFNFFSMSYLKLSECFSFVWLASKKYSWFDLFWLTATASSCSSYDPWLVISEPSEQL